MNETRMEEGAGQGGATDGVTRVDSGSSAGTTRMEGAPQAAGALASEFGLGYLFHGCRLIEPVRTESGEAVVWKTERDGRFLALKVYHHGKAPKKEIVEIMRRLPKEHTVELVEVGEDRGQFYELLEWIEHGSLLDWARMGAAPARVKEMLAEMTVALEAVHAQSVIHRDIKPANILVRSLDPLDLVLADFGISSVAAVSKHVTSAHRTPAYSAPEAISGVIKTSSDWWSVGVIALELLKGRHPFAGMQEMAMTHELVTRGITVPTDLSEEWQTLLKGLLTRDADKRWETKEVKQWLAGEKNIPVQYEAARSITGSGTGNPSGIQPYKLAGKEYGTVESLAAGLAQNWEEGVKRVVRGDVLKWIETEVRDSDLINLLKDIQEDKKLDAEQKLAVAVLALNPRLPLSWKGEVVDVGWLEKNEALARRIFSSSVPQWVKKFSPNNALDTLATDVLSLDEKIKGVSWQYDHELAWRLMFCEPKFVQDEVAKIRAEYVDARDERLKGYLTSSDLEPWQAIALLACDKEQLITQREVDEAARQIVEEKQKRQEDKRRRIDEAEKRWKEDRKREEEALRKLILFGIVAVAGVCLICMIAWIAGKDGTARRVEAASRQVDTQMNVFTNSLGMKFVPVSGTKVLFSVWETRVSDYEAFARATNREVKKPDFSQSSDHPVVDVSWDDAQAFYKWLTKKERREGKIKGSQSYRLPTDEEWSLAVGLPDEGSGTPREKNGKIKGVYPWGTQWPPPKGAGNYSPMLNVDSYEKTAPVGSFSPNQYGLYDMGGNVWEWCEDWYDGERKYRVLRGASWFYYGPVSAQSSSRDFNHPYLRNDNYGFRCVLAGGL